MRKDREFYICLNFLSQFPEELAKHLWPENTEEKVVYFFKKSCEQMKRYKSTCPPEINPFRAVDLTKRGVAPLVERWRNENRFTSRLSKNLKKELFALAML